MAKFNYTVTDNKGRTLTGSMDVTDRTTALATLRKQELRPISVKEVSGGGTFNLNNITGSTKVKSSDLVIFTRQLSTMINAGVPLLRGLSSMEGHTESPALKKILAKIITDIQGGSGFGDALSKHPNVFTDVYVNMVRAGETAGILDEILKRLAVQQEKNATIRKKIKSAMAYPVVLIVIMILAFFGLMLFVIPQLGKILLDLGGPDAQLPLLTRIMLGISDFIINYWYILVPAIIGGIFGLSRYIKTPRGKSQFHHIILKTPAVKTIVRKVAVARFARTFSALMGAGVAVLEALSVTGHAIGNVVYEKALLEAASDVESGQELSKVIEANPELFPAIVAQMLAVGEETGQTDTVLVKVADFYEEEVDVAIDGLSSIIEPVMILVMGSMVGLIAASVMSPIASLSQNIK